MAEYTNAIQVGMSFDTGTVLSASANNVTKQIATPSVISTVAYRIGNMSSVLYSVQADPVTGEYAPAVIIEQGSSAPIGADAQSWSDSI